MIFLFKIISNLKPSFQLNIHAPPIKMLTRKQNGPSLTNLLSNHNETYINKAGQR